MYSDPPPPHLTTMCSFSILECVTIPTPERKLPDCIYYYNLCINRYDCHAERKNKDSCDFLYISDLDGHFSQKKVTNKYFGDNHHFSNMSAEVTRNTCRNEKIVMAEIKDAGHTACSHDCDVPYKTL